MEINSENIQELFLNVQKVLEEHTKTLKLISNKFEQHDGMFSELAVQIANLSEQNLNSIDSLTNCTDSLTNCFENIIEIKNQQNKMREEYIDINEHILTIYELLKLK